MGWTKRIAVVASVGLLAGCGSSNEAIQAPTTSSPVSSEAAAANPAAEFCEEQGGTASGPEPLCTLSDGSTVDAWDYFRALTSGDAGIPPTAVPSSAAVTTAQLTTVPSTTIAPTTIPPPDPRTSLVNLAGALGALDYSKVSEGPCGTFGLIVESDRVTFYEWDGGNWNDQSDRLTFYGSSQITNRDTSEPLKVTSRDYTGDGVVEFLVEYGTARDSGPYRFGSIFYPSEDWIGDSWGCDWGWSYFHGDFDFFDSPPYPQTLEYLRWEDGLLRATQTPYKSRAEEAVVTFNPDWGDGVGTFEVRWP